MIDEPQNQPQDGGDEEEQPETPASTPDQAAGGEDATGATGEDDAPGDDAPAEGSDDDEAEEGSDDSK